MLRALWRKSKSLWFNVKLELTFKSYCVLFSYKLIRIYGEINHFSFHCPVQSLCIIHKSTKSMKIKKQLNKIFAKATREFTEPTDLLYLFLKCTYSGNKDFHSLILKKYSLPATQCQLHIGFKKHTNQKCTFRKTNYDKLKQTL